MAKQDRWKLEGTCSTHPERFTLWYPLFETAPDEIQRAKELCESCPVRVQCKLKGRGEKFGIWGGTLMGLDPGDFLED